MNTSSVQVKFAASLMPLIFSIPGYSTVTVGESKKLLTEKQYPVEHFTTTLIDKSRVTASNGSYKGDNWRSLKTTVWYPGQERSPEMSKPKDARIAKGPFPLLVYSHGFMSFRKEGKDLVEQLASQGYIVVATEHPLSHFFAPGGPNIKDVANQPGDVSFLIDTLLGWSKDKHHRFFGAVDKKRIGVLGVSLGGFTSTLVTYHPTLRDKRIAASISIAGPAAMFGEKFFETTQVPFMMIAADKDAMVDYETNAQIILDRVPGSVLVTNIGGSHTGFSHIGKPFFKWLSNPDSIGCMALNRGLKIDKDMENPFENLGGEDIGMIDAPKKFPSDESLGKAMPLAKQHAITALAAQSFFESHFHKDKTKRKWYRNYLAEVLAKENKLAEVEFAKNSTNKN